MKTDFLPTQRSLLVRLKNLDDQTSWKHFFDTYWKIIYDVARRAGLADAEAQDGVQETIIYVSRKMPVKAVVDRLGVKPAEVYFARHKVSALLKKELKILGNKPI